MIPLVLKVGRFLYGFGIIAIGVHQIILQDFRPDILPFHVPALPIVAGLLLILAGISIATGIKAKKVSIALALFFGVIIIAFQLPYILFFSTNGILRLDAWFGVGEEFAYCGGALIMARSYSESNYSDPKTGKLERMMIPAGTVMFSMLIILFGVSHFVFTEFVSTMVPGWLGAAFFWTYLVGVLLIAAGVGLILMIWVKTTAWLLAVMLFLFFLLFHVPDAIANPSVGGGNEIVRAIIALLFTGIALVIAIESDK
jgi:uncharacterized membrane protein YphA (DoxX/SURF4 family)